MVTERRARWPLSLVVLLLAVRFAMAPAVSAQAASEPDALIPVPDSWILILDEMTDRAELARIVSTGDEPVRVTAEFRRLPMLRVSADPDQAATMRGLPGVLDVVQDHAVRPPRLAEEPGDEGLERRIIELSDAVASVGAPEAWSKGFTGRGLSIVVVDTGVLTSHEMFTGKTIREACFSLPGNCPNGSTEMFGPTAATPALPAYEVMWHGTHVAAIALGGGASAYRGVAFEADLIATNIFTWTEGDICGGFPRCVVAYISDIARALDMTIDLAQSGVPIAAVNVSLNGPVFPSEVACGLYSPIFPIIVGNSILYQEGIAFSASAGDNSSCTGIAAPACIDIVMAVGAARPDGLEARFNNYEPSMLSFFAPGLGVRSAWGPDPDRYLAFSSTTTAAAFGSGAFTLLRQQRPHQGPGLLIDALRTFTSPLVIGCANAGDQGLLDLGAATEDPKRVPSLGAIAYGALLVAFGLTGSWWYRRSALRRLFLY